MLPSTKLPQLKEFIASYGEIQLLQDLAVHFQTLGLEWQQANRTDLCRVFDHAAIALTDAVCQLQQAETRFTNEQAPENQDTTVKLQTEFDELVRFFNDLSMVSFGRLWLNDRQSLYAKLQRFEQLRKQLKRK